MKSKIKIFIWIYIVLLIVEGALRKWVVPSLATPLLVVRDPVLFVIYGLAASAGLFPRNGWIAFLGGLAVASVALSVVAGQTHPVIMLYGLRTNYLHLPLIWVIAKVFDRRDVEKVGLFFLFTAIPMTLLMVMQFRSPYDAFVNRGVGLDTGEGSPTQLFGADGRIRPPGLFAFVTGPQLFYPLVAAFLLGQLGTTRLKLPWWLLIAMALAIGIALPVSISRTVMLGTCAVGVVYVFSLRYTTSKAINLGRPLLVLGVLFIALYQLPVFKEGMRVFMIRWTEAAVSSEGEGWSDVANRTAQTYLNPLYYAQAAPFFGMGIGIASNVAAHYFSWAGIWIAEEEWGKNLMELGPVLGFTFIGYRVALTFSLGLIALRALRSKRDALPILIFSACAIAISQGQLGPPTILGFAVLGPGLLLAALNPYVEEDGAANPVAAALAGAPAVPLGRRGIPRPSERRPPAVLR
jgi:hypothetical protein